MTGAFRVGAGKVYLPGADGEEWVPLGETVEGLAVFDPTVDDEDEVVGTLIDLGSTSVIQIEPGAFGDTLLATVGANVPVEPARMGLMVDSWECPVVAPVKRRGLTGKAYRIARRRYGRDMRAYRRGLIPPVRVRRMMPSVQPTEIRQVGQDAVSVGFKITSPAGERWWGDT